MRVTLLSVMACISTLSHVFGYSALKVSKSSRSSFRIYASKHIQLKTHSELARGGEITKETIVLDPKKIALLEKLGLGEEEEDKTIIPMTGAELRKDRKNVLRVKRNNDKHKLKQTESKIIKVKIIPEKPVRFALGCGIESLTASNLLDLVKSTAPYLFPESGK